MRLAIIFLGTLIVLLIVFGFVVALQSTTYGAFDQNIAESVRAELPFASMIALATTVGIFSRYCYDALLQTPDGHPDRLLRTFSFKTLLLSVIITPVVVGSFVKELLEIHNILLSLIFSYQNGFFFQTILSSKKDTRQ